MVRIQPFIAVSQFQTLVRELKFCKPCGREKKKKVVRKKFFICYKDKQYFMTPLF